MSEEKYKSVFSKNLNRLMNERGISQTDIIRDLKINKSTISTWCNGSRLPRMDKVQMIADYLGVYKSDLIEDKPKSSTPNYDNLYNVSKIKLPLLGNVACGEPIYADEDRESYIMIGTDIKADFCLKCQGDSMINARINDGDIVFVRKQDIVNNGEIAVVIIDDEATLKRFYYYKEQNLVILKPENPKYEDIVLSGDKLNEVKVLGKAIAFQSDII